MFKTNSCIYFSSVYTGLLVIWLVLSSLTELSFVHVCWHCRKESSTVNSVWLLEMWNSITSVLPNTHSWKRKNEIKEEGLEGRREYGKK